MWVELYFTLLKDENMNEGRAERIENLEQEIMQENKLKSGINIELKNRLKNAIISLDKGSNDESMIEICSLVYLPTWAAPKFPQNTERNQLETWVKLEIYEASLERQSEDAKAVQISGCAADKSCDSFFSNMKQAGMHFLQLHRQATYGHNKQYLTQPMTFRVYDSSSREEETNQIKVQSRTGTVNPSICPRSKTSEPNVNPIIVDVPNMTGSKMKAESNLNKSFTSGKDVGISHQGERISDTKSGLTEESHHIRTQTIYSPDNQNMHSGQKAGEPDRNLSKIITSNKEVEINHQTGEIHKTGRISDINSTLMEESHQVKMQTTIGINIPSRQQKEESSKPDSNPNKNLISGKDTDSSHQGGRISDTNSTLTEESHHVRTQTTHSRSSMHPEKEPGKSNRGLNKALTSKKDVQINHQAGEIHKTGRISDTISSLMEESHQVKMQTTNGIDSPRLQREEESGKPDSNPNKSLTSEKMLTAIIKVKGFQVQIPSLRKNPVMLGHRKCTVMMFQACFQRRELANPTET